MVLLKDAQECQLCGSLKKWLPTDPGKVTMITPDVLDRIILQCYGSCGQFVCGSCARRDREGPFLLLCPGCGGPLAQPAQ